MPGKSANVKNEKQYAALKDKGMSKERAAKIANAPGASMSRGEEVALLLVQQQLLAGRHDRPEEGGGPKGRPGSCAQVVTHTIGTWRSAAG